MFVMLKCPICYEFRVTSYEFTPLFLISSLLPTFLFLALDATVVVLVKTGSSGAFTLLSCTPGGAYAYPGLLLLPRWGYCSCVISQPSTIEP